jgi:hypothetical protein
MNERDKSPYEEKNLTTSGWQEKHRPISARSRNKTQKHESRNARFWKGPEMALEMPLVDKKYKNKLCIPLEQAGRPNSGSELQTGQLFESKEAHSVGPKRRIFF